MAAPRRRARRRGRPGGDERPPVAGAVPAPPPHRPGVVPGEDGDEPRRQDGGRRRVVALDHRRRRADAHRLRAESQAVVIGAGTALADHPSLDVDPPVDHQPLRVLLGARGRVPAAGPLFDAELAPTLVVTTEAHRPRRWTPGRRPGRRSRPSLSHGGVNLAATLDLLGRRDVLQAMVEGGATLHGPLLAAGLVDRLMRTSRPRCSAPVHFRVSEPDVGTMADAEAWRLLPPRHSTTTPASSTSPRKADVFTGIIEELGRVRAIDHREGEAPRDRGHDGPRGRARRRLDLGERVLSDRRRLR